MDEGYKNLLKEIANACAGLAEQVMDYDKKNGDEEGYKTATSMRDDYSELANRINEKELTRFDYLKLYAGAKIVCENLHTRADQLRKVIQGYETDIIPKLSRISNETETTEQANTLAKEIFQIK